MQSLKQNSTAMTSSLLVQTLQGKQTDRVPFWLMRQAGRYLPEYRALREKAGSFLNLCFHPEWAEEVTLQPIRRFDMDAAILFSDILVVPYAFGQPLEYAEGEGPVLDPVRTRDDFDRLVFDADKLSAVYETVARLKTSLPADKALIGFAGSPWTVACYMIEGRGKTGFPTIQAFAKENPEDFSILIDKLSDATLIYLERQIQAGADVVQLFDSWAGLLTDENDFINWVVKPTQKIIAGLKQKYPHIPVIGFPRQAGRFYGLYAGQTGINGLGLDQDANIEQVFSTVEDSITLQGNLSPEVVLKGGTEMEEAVLETLNTFAKRPYIFNLGHGVLKETDPEHIYRLSQIVKNYKR